MVVVAAVVVVLAAAAPVVIRTITPVVVGRHLAPSVVAHCNSPYLRSGCEVASRSMRPFSHHTQVCHPSWRFS
jgi:hypothetical protein